MHEASQHLVERYYTIVNQMYDDNDADAEKDRISPRRCYLTSSGARLTVLVRSKARPARCSGQNAP